MAFTHPLWTSTVGQDGYLDAQIDLHAQLPTVVDAKSNGGASERDGGNGRQHADEAQRVQVGELAQHQLHGAKDDDPLLQRNAALRVVRQVDRLERQTGSDLNCHVVTDGGKLLEEGHGPVAPGACRQM
jgi:hypothetical protein